MLVPITVREVMSSPAETIPIDTSVRDAATRLLEADVGSLIVVEAEEPVGIITETDLVTVIARAIDPDQTSVEEPMSAPLLRIEADASIEEAATTLQTHNVKRLPVFEDDQLVGVVSARDLSFYIPSLAVGLGVTPADESRTTFGSPETTYDEEGWEFTYHDETRDGVGVGDVVRFTKRITETDVRRFANASGDTNRLHLDESFATETRFGRRIVHGTLVLGVISAALARIPGLTIYLSQDVSFLAPVDVGDTVTATCRVVSNLGKNRFQLATVVVTGAGETVVDGEATVLIDPTPGSETTAASVEPVEA